MHGQNHIKHPRNVRSDIKDAGSFRHTAGSKHDVTDLTLMYSRTSFIRINWDGELSGYAEIPDNWIFSLKTGHIVSLQFCCYYSQYVPRLNLSTTPDLQFYKP